MSIHPSSLRPYVFGYFATTQSWKDVMHIQWVCEFLDVIRNHESTFRFVEQMSFSEQKIHRFVVTQQQPQKRFASQTRMKTDKHTGLPYASFDWQTPLGICRFLEDIHTSGKLPQVFVRYVPLHDTMQQRIAEVFLGRRYFEEYIVGRKWNDATRILCSRMSSRESVEEVRKLILELDEWTYPSSVEELERSIFSNRKRGTLELLKEIRDISNELRTFLKSGTLDSAKVESRLSRMEKIVRISESDIVEVSPEEFRDVFHTSMSSSSSPSTNHELQEEYDRLVQLLEKHKIDYIQVPNQSLELLQSFISDQLSRQQKLAITIFDELSSNAEKFAAENELDKIQKKVETAKRKQFEFDTFFNERVCLLESHRTFIEEVRTRLVERYRNIDFNSTFSKLPFKTRRLFPDSEIGAFIQSSNTHYQCWISTVRGDTSIDYFKIQSVRKGICTLLESYKCIPSLLFLFHFGYQRFLQWDDMKNALYSFLLQLDCSVCEVKSGLI